MDGSAKKDQYTLIEESFNSGITCMQYSQKNLMRIIGNDQKNNGQNFWEILERIIGKISSIIGAGLNGMRLYITFEKSGGLHLAEPGLMAGWLADEI